VITVQAELINTLTIEQTLSAQYVALDAIVKDKKGDITTQRKANREKAEGLFKSLGTAIEAVNCANAILPKRMVKDANARKVAQRQRDWLKARLAVVFKDYDFETNGSSLVAVLVGDEAIREARELLVSFERINSLTKGGKVNEDILVEAIRKETVQAKTVDPVNGSSMSEEILSQLLAARGLTISDLTKAAEQKQA
jgi:hypothetical protein